MQCVNLILDPDRQLTGEIKHWLVFDDILKINAQFLVIMEKVLIF